MNWTTEQARRPRYHRTPVRYGVQHLSGDYLTVREAANGLRITRQAVRARIRSGKLPALKVADMWYVKRSDIARTWTV